MSLCPICNERPRRAPGHKCTSCAVRIKRERRAELRTGAPAKERVKPESAKVFSRKLNATRYLVTSAQNATPVHGPFLAALKVAAAALSAELVVIPLRYKNPTSIWSAREQTDDWWAPELEPYLYNQRKKLGPNLVLVGDVRIQPTAQSPLSGFESLTGKESCIIGHPKMQFRSVAAPSGRYPKILSTTGSVTKRNFTDTKAGALGDFHHYLGAVLVELDGKYFHLRQLNADRQTGEFTDLDRVYSADGVSKAPPALGLMMGDTHARFADPVVDRATFGPGGIVETINPQHLVWEDVFDGYSVNPHHFGNPFIAQAKYRARFGNVREEVEHAVKFIAERTGNRKSIVVASNHDDFLSRWVSSTDWRSSPGNAAFYLETAQAMVASARMTPRGAEYADPFVHWLNKLKGDADIRTLGANESFTLAGIEHGLHGHKGPDGARGTVKNLSKLGAKINSAHGHAPAIENGHYRVGTSTPLQLEYTGGPSSWQNTHVVTYASGKRALLTVVDGRWHRRDSPKRKK